MLRPPPQRMPVRLSKRNARRLWLVTALDMVTVAWMIAVGTWLDQTSKLTQVITLGGHHALVLIMALVGFADARQRRRRDQRVQVGQQAGADLDHRRLHNLRRHISRSTLTPPALRAGRAAARLPRPNVPRTLTGSDFVRLCLGFACHEAEYHDRSER